MNTALCLWSAEGVKLKLWARVDDPGERKWCPEFGLFLQEWKAVKGLRSSGEELQQGNVVGGRWR